MSQTNQSSTGKSRQVWTWLDTPSHIKPKVGVSDATPLRMLHAESLRY